MTANELRQKYLDFFKSKGHKVIPSASLVPENDPSVLFTTAGMHPLVPYLLGQPHPEGTRLVDYQKCVRTGDIEEVGDNTHLTFFEMLGNWSLGDYFKEDSIKWSFEFLTSSEWLNIPVDRLAVSVFEGDKETPRDEMSAKYWLDLGLSEARIAYLDKEENWWPAGGKHLGPQGPDTEIFYWTGEDSVPEKFDPDNEQWVEIWNNVFMEFNKTEKGLDPLEKKNVDTGMGLERTVAILQGKPSVYDTELFQPIFRQIENEALDKGVSVSYKDHGASMRIIADHVRTAVMMASDGVIPSNKDQGYVMRRLIRRSMRKLDQLGVDKRIYPSQLIGVIIGTLQEAYPVLKEKEIKIHSILQDEEQRFAKTLEDGLKWFDRLVAEKQLTGQNLFILYTTYGFPIEVSLELAREKDIEVSEGAMGDFEQRMAEHQEKSSEGAKQKFAGGLADHSQETVRLHTATHLLHQALRTVLGQHVEQKGSNITPKRLRFDFSHPQKMTDNEKQEVEKLVNEAIKKNYPVHFEDLSIEAARDKGAIGLFGDKYASLGNKVKVYSIGDLGNGECFSREVCGGPHVKNTKELGKFSLKKEESASAGVRRIKAVLTDLEE